MPLYVEIRMRAPMERLWEYTQDPYLHARWDLRFSTIEYLPRPDSAKPQQFLYSTRIGFGLAIRGKGETTGSREDAAGMRTSALKFWSDNPISLIREGSGYWQYVPTQDGIRFLTQYNYTTRLGAFGALLDRLIFRPLMGWATAWSFDCLRLWLEEGIAPEISIEKSAVHALARVTLAFLWFYQGLVPKLLFRDSGEMSMLQHVPFIARNLTGHEQAGFAILVLSAMGLGEMLFGAAIVAFWRARLILHLNNWGLLFLGLGALVSQPRIFVAPFNPLTFNLAMAALAAIGLLCSRNLPSARSCLRKKPEKTG